MASALAGALTTPARCTVSVGVSCPALTALTPPELEPPPPLTTATDPSRTSASTAPPTAPCALASARVALQQAQTDLTDRIVRAPFSGHVGLTEIDRGDRVSDTTPITQIDQRGTLYVDFPAPEAVFNALRPGQTVQVTPFSDGSRTIDARVVTTDSRISQDSRDFIVRTAIPNNDDRLRPGMSFRVVFERQGEARPVVPEQAIVWGGEGSHIFVASLL